jgi:hypothetical protein
VPKHNDTSIRSVSFKEQQFLSGVGQFKKLGEISELTAGKKAVLYLKDGVLSATFPPSTTLPKKTTLLFPMHDIANMEGPEEE